MNEQEFFTQTLVKIRAQGGPAINQETKRCAYRAPDGRGCAIGVHLPDDVALSLRQLDTVESRTMRPVLGAAGLDSLRLDLLMGLQGAHDTAAVVANIVGGETFDGPEFFERWEPKMRALATEYGLEYTEPAS